MEIRAEHKTAKDTVAVYVLEPGSEAHASITTTYQAAYDAYRLMNRDSGPGAPLQHDLPEKELPDGRVYRLCHSFSPMYGNEAARKRFEFVGEKGRTAFSVSGRDHTPLVLEDLVVPGWNEYDSDLLPALKDAENLALQYWGALYEDDPDALSFDGAYTAHEVRSPQPVLLSVRRQPKVSAESRASRRCSIAIMLGAIIAGTGFGHFSHSIALDATAERIVAAEQQQELYEDARASFDANLGARCIAVLEAYRRGGIYEFATAEGAARDPASAAACEVPSDQFAEQVSFVRRSDARIATAEQELLLALDNHDMRKANKALHYAVSLSLFGAVGAVAARRPQ